MLGPTYTTRTQHTQTGLHSPPVGGQFECREQLKQCLFPIEGGKEEKEALSSGARRGVCWKDTEGGGGMCGGLRGFLNLSRGGGVDEGGEAAGISPDMSS